MKIQELDPTIVSREPSIAARIELDKENVAEIARTFVVRRENNQVHQIQAGVVRSKDNKFQIIDGAHRWAACIEANAALGKDEEPFLFHAVVVKEGDSDALVTAIMANEKRKNSNIFDRADGMARLMDKTIMGKDVKSQDEIAVIYGVDKSTVSRTLSAGKLPAKLRKMVLNGDIEEDAALLLGSTESVELRAEILEKARAESDFLAEMSDRIEKDTEAKAAPKGKGKVAEEPDADDKPANGKTKKTNPKISKEAVARAAKATPGAKGTKIEKASAGMTKKQLFVYLDSMLADKVNPLPATAKALLKRFQAFFDGEITAANFRSSLAKNCIPDEG